jgi:hypothetical protein
MKTDLQVAASSHEQDDEEALRQELAACEMASDEDWLKIESLLESVPEMARGAICDKHLDSRL